MRQGRGQGRERRGGKGYLHRRVGRDDPETDRERGRTRHRRPSLPSREERGDAASRRYATGEGAFRMVPGVFPGGGAGGNRGMVSQESLQVQGGKLSAVGALLTGLRRSV